MQSVIHDRFVACLSEVVRALEAGDGGEPAPRQGPRIAAAAAAKLRERIADGIATGVVSHVLGGTFFEPMVLTGVTPPANMAREETFDSLAPVFRLDIQDLSQTF